MKRRAFVGLVGCTLLAGCGGGSREKKRTVRGIVLEDDGAGNVRPAGAGRAIKAIYFEGPSSLDAATAQTDSHGEFTVSLPEGYAYSFLTSAYPQGSEIDSVSFYPSCATVPVASVFKNSGLNVYYGTSGSVLSDEWRTRSFPLIAQYNVDVVILADLACVGQV